MGLPAVSAYSSITKGSGSPNTALTISFIINEQKSEANLEGSEGVCLQNSKQYPSKHSHGHKSLVSQPLPALWWNT